MFVEGLLKDRVALVTGGGTGIGRGIASLLGDLGATVALLGRRAEVVQLAASDLRRDGADVHAWTGDVRNFSDVSGVLAEVSRKFGGLDILVNNAAGNFVCPTAELSPGGWKAIVDIDLNGTFNCCRAAYPLLKASAYTGRIVSISTTYAWSGWPKAAAAAASKAGVISLMRTLAVEWGGDNIRCNTVLPGLVGGTEGARRMHLNAGRAESEIGRIPAGECARIEDIANAVGYLVSPLGIYCNGSDLVVDGGRQFAFG